MPSKAPSEESSVRTFALPGVTNILLNLPQKTSCTALSSYHNASYRKGIQEN